MESRDSLESLEPVEPGGFQEVDLVGSVVAGRYLVQRRLGEGGMGVVYAALDERIEKQIAIKVLRADYTRRSDVVARFTQEAKSAARIKHENVLDITDYGQTEDGGFYIAMELLRGTDLADVLMEHKTLPAARGIEIAVQVCRALTAAHAKGIVHRDLKPENIFIVRGDDDREIVKIVDFGIAQMKDLGGSESSRKLTRTGMIFGTPEYMSPEQAAGKAIDHRVDIYAAGVILYEMFAGRVPFVGESFMGILTQHMFEHPSPIVQINPAVQISAELESVVFKAMAKDPKERYGSMAELAEDLNRIRAGARPMAPTPDLTAVLPKPPGGPRASHLAANTRASGGEFTGVLPASVGAGVSNPTPQMTGVSRTIENELPAPRQKPMLRVAVLVCVVGVAVLVAAAIGSGFGTGSGTDSGTQVRTAPPERAEPAERHEGVREPGVVLPSQDSGSGAGTSAGTVALRTSSDAGAGAAASVDAGTASAAHPPGPARRGHARVRPPVGPVRPGCGGTDPNTGLLIPCFQQ